MSNKRGCPTCDGIDAKSCMRCRGKTRLDAWVLTEHGYKYQPIVKVVNVPQTTNCNNRAK